MNQDELDAILQKHKLWLDDADGGIRADLKGADLRGAGLWGAGLWGAGLWGAVLRGADLRGADLRGADLYKSNLRHADLSDADLRRAKLRYANLSDADLRGADLRGADLDYSCFPLWCGSKGMIVDRRIAAQIAAHFCALECDDADYIAAREAILEFAQTSHRAEELGIKEWEG